MLRLAIRVHREHAELALAELLELVPGGMEEVDIDPDTIEYAIYGSAGVLPELPALQAALGSLGDKLAYVEGFSPSDGSAVTMLVDFSTTEVADDWAERWREFHKPLVLGTRLSVRPPWEPAIGTDVELVIDPGQAFGTGAHATTRLCLELLLELEPPSAADVVDLGCGSGVLGIAAARLGWGPVLGLDFDQLAVEATEENAQINEVQLSVQRFDLRDRQVPPASLVLANLLGPLLRDWCSQMAAGDGERSRRVIASGLLKAEADGISAAFGEVGYAETDRRERDGWAALVMDLS